MTSFVKQCFAKISKSSLRFRLPVFLLLVILFLLPSGGLGIKLCLFNICFDYPCPFCGLTRSLTALLHLDLQNGFLYHPAGIVFILFFIMIIITNNPNYLSDKFAKNRISYWLFSVNAIYTIFLGIWIVRLIN